MGSEMCIRDRDKIYRSSIRMKNAKKGMDKLGEMLDIMDKYIYSEDPSASMQARMNQFSKKPKPIN